MRDGMKIKFVSNDTGARFVVRQSIPIGLNGDSQRSMHTNLVGRLMEGCFKVGENVSVPLKDGNTKSVQLIGISVPADWAHAHKSSKFPESITADPAKDITIALSVRIRPHDADTVLAQIVGPQLKYNEIPSRFARRNASALLPGEKLRHRRGVIAAQRVGYELKVVMGVPFVRIGAGELAKQRWRSTRESCRPSSPMSDLRSLIYSCWPTSSAIGSPFGPAAIEQVTVTSVIGRGAERSIENQHPFSW